jgi:hypothetical protein
MKSKFLLCFVFALFFTKITAQINIPPPEIPNEFNEIRKILAQQETDWNNGDIDAYMKGYWQSDSLKFITKKGITRGWFYTLENYKKSYPNKSTMGNLKFNIVSMEYYCGQRIMVLGKWTIVSNKKTVTGYFSLLWQKIDDNWVIIIDHTS